MTSLWKHNSVFVVLLFISLLLFSAPSHSEGAVGFSSVANSPYLFQDNTSTRYKLYGIHVLERKDNPPLFEQAKQLSADFLIQDSLHIERVKEHPDRYGFYDVILWNKDKSSSLQEALLDAGVTKIDIEDDALDEAVLKRWKEIERRSPFKGFYRLKNNNTVEKHKFQIVEDRIHSLTERGKFVYINFDENWQEDFTVMIPKKLWQQLDATDFEAGKTIRVRGFSEHYYGPLIKINSLHQIEFL